MKVWIATFAVLLTGSLALADAGKVRVEPFTEANETQQPDWISRALHQAVVDDLSSHAGLEVVRADDSSEVRYVVTGSIQRVEGQLRVTGRVEDKSTGKIIGSFKATGAERDLFTMEDTIAEQLRQAFGPAPTTAPAPQLAQSQPPLQSQQPQQPPVPSVVQRTGYDGSELQRALDERDYLLRLAQRQRNYYDQPTYNYQTPLYPYVYGINGNYYPPYYGWNSWGGGWGWGGWCGNIIIKPGCALPVTPANNGQAIRRAASYSGNAPSISQHTMVGGPIMTSGPTPAAVAAPSGRGGHR